jgi:hypothetical protein
LQQLRCHCWFGTEAVHLDGGFDMKKPSASLLVALALIACTAGALWVLTFSPYAQRTEPLLKVATSLAGL